ncbi:TonB-dependent receptor [Candidatus Halobeggiatoa sp. HSG11]|nr:TonB-dependent receptor [Candidatus Halobeggiatoa sp. HSG11]
MNQRFVYVLLFLYPTLNIAETILPEVTVTATRSAQTSPLASVSIITRDDIVKSQAVSIFDILHGIPGLDIVNHGGLGQPTSIFMRGTESDHILVLIDGIKVGSATTGSMAFEHLPVSQIERIEIVRGPRSSLYGSEAIGGVIQIFTRHGKKPQAESSIGIGSDNTYRVTTGFSGATENSWLSLYADHLKTDGFNACKYSCFAFEPDDDGYENTSFSTKFGHNFADTANVEVHALRTKGYTQFDSSFNNQADFTQQVIGIKADYIANDWWLLNLNIGESQDKYEQSAQNYFNTTRTVYGLQNKFFFAEQELIIGYEEQTDDVGSHVYYAIDSLTNKGLFAEYQADLFGIDLLVGLREDDNEQFGKHTTKNISLGYALGSTTRLIASYGTAFKAPSFNELYFPNYGNSKLVPEESESYEVGLIGKQQNYNWSINAYKTLIDKLIATNFDSVTNSYFADNINKVKIVGMDGAINWHQGNWEFNTKVSWLKPEDDTTGNLLPRRAEKSINVELAEKRGPMRLSINVLAHSYRYDNANNTNRLAGYGIVNLAGEYNFNKNLALRMRLENMLGKDYETAYSYNTPNQFWFLSLHYW